MDAFKKAHIAPFIFQALCMANVATAAPGASVSAVAETGKFDDIIVTARRRTENLQHIPVSASVYSKADLLSRSIFNVTDAIRLTSNANIAPATATKYAASIAIRGQIQSDNLLTLDPSVGIYVNDVYFARAYAALFDLLDVASVEVLKGPQGTLYGRNTTGGAIKISTAAANPEDKTSGFIRASYGNYNAKTINGALNLTLAPGIFALRYAGSVRKHDGYSNSYLIPTLSSGFGTVGLATSLTPVRQIKTDDENATAHRLSFRFTPSDSFSLDVVGGLFNAKDNGAYTVGVYGDIQNYPNIFFGAPPNGASSIYSSSPQHAADFRSALTDFVPSSSVDVKSLSSTLQWKLSEALTTKLILGYVQARNESASNADGTVTPSLAFLQIQPFLHQYQHQTSEEFQVLGKAFDNKLSYIVGLYHFDEAGTEFYTGTQFYTFNTNSSTNFAFDASNQSSSAFAHAIFAATDTFHISGGLRYTKDIKALDTHTRDASAGFPGICAITDLAATSSTNNGGPCSLLRKDNFHYITWEIGADYRLTPDVFVYAKANNGQRSGGEQGRAFGSQSNLPFKPERVINYEVGVKNEVLDKHLRFNLTYFHDVLTDSQQTQIVVVGGRTTTVVVNKGSAKIDGIEAESVFRLNTAFTLSASLGYTDFRFADASVIQPLVPKWTYGLSAAYEQPTAIGLINLRLDYNYVGRRFYDTSAATPENSIAGYGLLNSRLSFAFNGGASLAVFGKNLTNKNYYTSVLQTGYGTPGAPPYFGLRGGSIGAPRVFGVEAGFSF